MEAGLFQGRAADLPFQVGRMLPTFFIGILPGFGQSALFQALILFQHQDLVHMGPEVLFFVFVYALEHHRLGGGGLGPGAHCLGACTAQHRNGQSQSHTSLQNFHMGSSCWGISQGRHTRPQ